MLSEADDELFKDITEKVGMAKKPIHVRQFRNTLLEWIKDLGKPCFYFLVYLSHILSEKNYYDFYF